MEKNNKFLDLKIISKTKSKSINSSLNLKSIIVDTYKQKRKQLYLNHNILAPIKKRNLNLKQNYISLLKKAASIKIEDEKIKETKKNRKSKNIKNVILVCKHLKKSRSKFNNDNKGSSSENTFDSNNLKQLKKKSDFKRWFKLKRKSVKKIVNVKKKKNMSLDIAAIKRRDNNLLPKKITLRYLKTVNTSPSHSFKINNNVKKVLFS